MDKKVYIRYINPYQKMSGFKKFIKWFFGDKGYMKFKYSSPDSISEIESYDDFISRLMVEIKNLGDTNSYDRTIFNEHKYNLVDNDIFCVVEDTIQVLKLLSNNIFTITPIYVSDHSKYKQNKNYRLIISAINSERFQYLKEEEVRNIIRKNKLNKLKSL